MAFLDGLAAGSGETWRAKLSSVTPSIDQGGRLAGPWGECLVQAVIQEHSGHHNCPAGQVIDFLCEKGHGGFESAADKLERLSHRVMEQGGFNARPRSAADPEVWSIYQLLSQAGGESSAMRERAPSSGSSGSSGSIELDAASKQICRSAPLRGRIGQALDQCVRKLPDEVHAVMLSKGACITSSKHLKTSFHSTWLVDLDPPAQQDGKTFASAIVQVVGTEVGDRPLSFRVSVQVLTRAMSLAEQAGVRVPAILATGSFETEVGELEFLAQEFIKTETVEDKVMAPSDEWHRLATAVNGKLDGLPLLNADTTPLPRYESLADALQWLRSLVPSALTQLHEALDSFERGSLPASMETQKPVLIHQDINCGNLLASKHPSKQEWVLDAIIDWESAVVTDPRLLRDKKDEPWRSAALFGHVAKGAYLAGCVADDTLPRCELEALVENYVEAGQELSKRGLLRYEAWSALVECCRKAAASKQKGASKGYSGR